MAHEETVAAEEYTYTAVFQPEEDGGYVVTFPALPGCISQGETLEEARAMAGDALELYLEVLKSEGRSIPIESAEETSKPLRERVSVHLKTA